MALGFLGGLTQAILQGRTGSLVGQQQAEDTAFRRAQLEEEMQRRMAMMDIADRAERARAQYYEGENANRAADEARKRAIAGYEPGRPPLPGGALADDALGMAANMGDMSPGLSVNDLETETPPRYNFAQSERGVVAGMNNASREGIAGGRLNLQRDILGETTRHHKAEEAYPRGGTAGRGGGTIGAQLTARQKAAEDFITTYGTPEKAMQSVVWPARAAQYGLTPFDLQAARQRIDQRNMTTNTKQAIAVAGATGLNLQRADSAAAATRREYMPTPNPQPVPPGNQDPQPKPSVNVGGAQTYVPGNPVDNPFQQGRKSIYPGGYVPPQPED